MQCITTLFDNLLLRQFNVSTSNVNGTGDNFTNQSCNRCEGVGDLEPKFVSQNLSTRSKRLQKQALFKSNFLLS